MFNLLETEFSIIFSWIKIILCFRFRYSQGCSLLYEYLLPRGSSHERVGGSNICLAGGRALCFSVVSIYYPSRKLGYLLTQFILYRMWPMAVASRSFGAALSQGCGRTGWMWCSSLLSRTWDQPVSDVCVLLYSLFLSSYHYFTKHSYYYWEGQKYYST